MNVRVLVPLVALIGGGVLGFGAGGLVRPVAPAAHAAQPAREGDEVVVEVRVKLPPGAVRPGDDGRPASTRSQGALLNTGNPLDLAIEGDGYFQLLLPSGDVAYTRDGVFGQNAQGNIVTKQGHLLTPQVTIPNGTQAITIGIDGVVTVTQTRSKEVSQAGQICLSRFPSPGWLRRDADGLSFETDESGPSFTATPGVNNIGLIRQGFRERQAELDAVTLTDLVRDIVREQQVRVRVER